MLLQIKNIETFDLVQINDEKNANISDLSKRKMIVGWLYENFFERN
jgi:hypothetical protein